MRYGIPIIIIIRIISSIIIIISIGIRISIRISIIARQLQSTVSQRSLN
jgi:5-bromo-4-chloroindolyl phosphate hydrolysis protein